MSCCNGRCKFMTAIRYSRMFNKAVLIEELVPTFTSGLARIAMWQRHCIVSPYDTDTDRRNMAHGLYHQGEGTFRLTPKSPGFIVRDFQVVVSGKEEWT